MREIPVSRKQLHEKVADLVRADILQKLKPGDKLDGERGLAGRFGVSVATVREALRSLAQDDLVQRRHGSGTYVSDRSRAQHVGVLIELNAVQPGASQFHLRVGQELRAFFLEHGVAARL